MYDMRYHSFRFLYFRSSSLAAICSSGSQQQLVCLLFIIWILPILRHSSTAPGAVWKFWPVLKICPVDPATTWIVITEMKRYRYVMRTLTPRSTRDRIVTHTLLVERSSTISSISQVTCIFIFVGKMCILIGFVFCLFRRNIVASPTPAKK